MRPIVYAFAAGLLFGAGLLLAGMTLPERVQGFLDFTGNWDPSLAFVMAGAIAVHLPLEKWVRRRQKPLVEPAFELPVRKQLDGRLLGGAAIFGVGWGLVGICPGPGLVALATGSGQMLAFVVAMIAGMALHRLLPAAGPAAVAQPAPTPAPDA